jgi:Icc-related predicted phosphoesterase
LAVNVILHFTDPHFNKASFGFIAKTATALHADVCISGDLLDASRGASFRLARQIEWVQSWVLDQPFKLFLCSGHHDTDRSDDPFSFGWLNELHNGATIITDGHRGTGSEGEAIACAGVDHVFDPASPLLDRLDVLVFHEPPAGSPTAALGGVGYGSVELARFLDTAVRPPRLVLTGDVHRPRKRLAHWRQSVVLNPGTCDVATKRPFVSIKFHPGEAEPTLSLV